MPDRNTAADAAEDGVSAMALKQSQPTIMDLEAIVSQLDPGARALFERLYRVTTNVGQLVPPPSMYPWIQQQFGSLEAVTDQRVVRVTNVQTLDDALFNELRARRPMEMKNGFRPDEYMQGGNDPLAVPQEGTPADTFGRVEGRFSITASNVAKPDAVSGLVVFNAFNPLHFTREQVVDYIQTATRWAEAAHQADPAARYYLFMWNCLWRAGASLLHGHAQMMVGRGKHYGKVEHLRVTARRYQEQNGSSFFDDLYRAHDLVGCALEHQGIRIVAHLTPVKEKETLLMSDRLDQRLMGTIYDTLACLRDQLGVHSFNLVMYMPPFGPADVDEDWSGFPVLVRIVDRGDYDSRTSDIGAMELYAASIISSDPMTVARHLRRHIQGQGINLAELSNEMQ